MAKYREMLTLTIPSIDAMMEILSTQSKPTIANWTIDYAERVILPLWLKCYPDDSRPQHALTAARGWLDGKVKCLHHTCPDTFYWNRAIRRACHCVWRAWY